MNKCPTSSEWSQTNAGKTAENTCPPGYSGKMTRVCNSDGSWGSINSDNCKIIPDTSENEDGCKTTIVRCCGDNVEQEVVEEFGNRCNKRRNVLKIIFIICLVFILVIVFMSLTKMYSDVRIHRGGQSKIN